MFLNNYKNYNTYFQKNILAIDYGTKKLGLGTFCPGKDPFPLSYGKITHKSLPQVLEELASIIDNEQIDIIVLGVPFLLDGQETEMTRHVKDFGVKLQEHISTTKVFLQDETLSTFEAESRMKNSPRYGFKVKKEELDALAATIIIEDFIKARN